MAEIEVRKLQNRILAFAVAGTLVTGIVVGLATAIPHYRYARAQAEQAALFHARVQASALTQLLAKWRDVAMQVTSRTAIRDRLEQYNRGEVDLGDLRAFSEPKLRDALDQSEALVGLVRLDRGGNPVMSLGTTVPRELWPRPEDHAARLTGPVATADGRFLLAGAPILNRHGERVGTDVLTFRIAPLLPLLENLNGFGPQAQAWLMEAGGEYALRAGAGGEQLVERGRLPELEPVLRSALSGTSALAQVPLRSATAAVYAPVEVGPWALVVTLPEQVLYAPALHQMGIPLASVLLMVLIGAAVTVRIIRPLGRRTVGQARRLEQSAAEQRVVLENARDFVYRHDLNGVFTYVSPAVERVTGYPPEQWLAHYTEFMTDNPVNARVPELAEAAGRGGAAQQFRVEIRHREGRPVLLEVNEQAYFEHGRAAGVVGVARDVSDRARMERELAQAAAEWTLAMDSFSDAVVLADRDGRLVRANQAFFDLTETEREAATGRPLTEVLGGRVASGRCRICELSRSQADCFETLEADDPDNPTGRPVEIAVRSVRGGEGEISGTLVALHDLTRSRRTEEELHLAASVFEGAHEGIVVTDAERRVLRVNRAFTEITGFGPDEALGSTLQQVLCSRRHDDLYHQRVWDQVQRTGLWQGEVWYRRKDGEAFPVWHRISAQRNARGEVAHYINLLTDITDKKRSEARIDHLARFDVLTDLPNRATFGERLGEALEWAARRERHLALLFIDLDRFKNVNDTLGHPAGDELLRQVAARLRESVRARDLVARLGGDEFTVVVEDVESREQAAAVAHKIIAALAEPVQLGAREVVVGGSIGIAWHPEDGRDVETLVKNADTAMFRAKEQGRNAVCFYDPEMGQRASERFELEAALRGAAARGELLLHYQPLVDLAAGRIVGAECLLRWNRPGGGMVPPDHFIPLAEESGLIEPIGRWVLEQACAQAQRWREAGLAFERLAVNLSGHQIVHGDIVSTVHAVLERTGLDPGLLELEVTESFVMAHPEQGVATLRGLRELGVALAVDDFGTGHSSLAYLKRLPVNRLKIDRSFVRDIPDDKDDTAIASTIIAMARHLQLDVIAEGVETEEQLAFLRAEGCDEYQGYLCSPALPAEAFEKLVREAAARGRVSAC